MKKQYGKPEVSFENFSLSSNIAGSCGSSLNNFNPDGCFSHTTLSDPIAGGCVYVENGYSVFTNVAICDVHPDEGNSWSKVCYHVITDDLKAFTS